MVTASPATQEQLAGVAAELERAIGGEVRFDHYSRLLYATDASIYQIMPHGVVIPRDLDDIAATVELAGTYELPILPRGAGTSLSGQATGAAIVVDCSKYLHRLLDVNEEERTCRVQPGLVVAELNRLLEPYGLMYGPDPASLDRATVGGTVGNNSTGAHSILYGMTADNVVAAKVLLADGRWRTFESLDPEGWQARRQRDDLEGAIYRSMLDLVDRYGSRIERDFPRHWRRSSGYNLDRLLRGVKEERLNLAEVFVGSEGTLGFLGEVTVKLVPRPTKTALAVLEFEDMIRSLEAVMPLLETEPAAIELVDRYLIDLTRKQLGYARALTWVEGDPESVLIVEFFGETEAELRKKLDAVGSRIRRWGYDGRVLKVLDEAEQERVWYVRKVGLGLLMSIRGDWKPIPFVEDVSVPPPQLPEFIDQFRTIVRNEGTDAAFYAHASAGCLHCRPLINLKTEEGVRMMRRIADQVVDLATEFGGAMSGEHGDGLARSEFNERVFGPELYGAMRELKGAWDPENRFNPGKVVNAPKMDTNLRYGPEYRTTEPATLLSFEDMEGFARAIEQCNGMGVCRNLHGGVMCPSYRATREEADSTRGRANVLRAAISGRLVDGLVSKEVHDVLDLCLECKACKSECPSQVDMAKLKYEFQEHYYAAHRRPIRDYLFGHIREFNQLAAPIAPIVNGLAGSALATFTQRQLGIAPERRLPPVHRETFRRWYAKHVPHPNAGRLGEVVLFADTFTNYNYPEAGRAATRVLEACGWSVHLAPNVCCGRPLISKGFLNKARRRAEQVVTAMAPFVNAEIPVIGLEPSCLLTFRDEVPDFLPDHPDVEALEANSYLLSEFLQHQAADDEIDLPFAERRRRVLFHGHCHEKTLVGTPPSLDALRLVPGQEVEFIESTCCGMAGSFGFEAQHYVISHDIASLDLLPALQAAPEEAEIAISGVSCRQQIAQFTERRPRHIAEILADAIVDGAV